MPKIAGNEPSIRGFIIRRIEAVATSKRVMMNKTTDIEAILRGVIDEWKAGVDGHEPQRIAALFTRDAIFQGAKPYSVGPQGVAAYYASQPAGLAAAYQIRETRRLADDLVLGFLSVDFSFTDRPTLSASLCVLLKQVGSGWYICYYQISILG